MHENISQQSMNMIDSQNTNLLMMDRSLKGLLMDKGGEGLEEKIQTLLRKIGLIQLAMESIVEQQRYSREQSNCDCLDMYLALNLRAGLGKQEAEYIKAQGVSVIQISQTRMAPVLEWRARKGFADEYGYASTRRIHAFNKMHPHYTQVREYVEKTCPGYYEKLAGYDAVRVTLNNSLKSIRKSVVDLTVLAEESGYPSDVVREAEKLSRRIFKSLPDSEAIAQVLNQLYC